jgi:hypothetical protein
MNKNEKKNRLYIKNPADCNNVVVALIHNDYTVRVGNEKVGKSSVKYVEYSREEKEKDAEK